MRLRTIIFRVDASLEIGTGHVMRCLTLAKALRERRCECHFISREHPGNLNDLVSERGFTVHNLPATDMAQEIEHELDSPVHTAWLGTDWQTDAAQVRSVIGDMPVDWLIVDHYALDANWERELRTVCRKILVIDDLADRQHDCDLLLDQKFIKDWQGRYHGKVPDNCGLMLGPEYALLHPVYADLHDRVPPREGPVRRILVYFGGADNDNLTGMVVSAFKSLRRDDVMLDVVISPASPHIDSIRRQVAENQLICLHEHLPTLAPLMVKADLAVGAGGATSWERCCLGLPTVVITLADNQRPIAEELRRIGLVLYLGHKDAIDETVIAQELQKILESGISPDWSTKCRKLVDGQGVGRVADLVLLNSKTPLQARLARRDDEKILLAWANDPLVRKNAFNTEQIDVDTHRKWFYDRLRDLEHCRIFVLETENGLPIGQVRFDHHSPEWEITYSLDPCARGRGVGKAILETAILAFRKSTNHALIFAQVKDSNQRSRNILEQLNFVPKEGGGRYSIAVCSDLDSWINGSIPELILGWLVAGHIVSWAHDAGELPGGDLCFYLSYGRIVDDGKRSRYLHNLVVHESDLPKGRGWSPMTWQILEGTNRIPVTLLEAVDAVDAGPIYLQDCINFNGQELIDEIRKAQSDVTIALCRKFVAEYPHVVSGGQEQIGEASYYPKRRPENSRLQANKTIAEQFNLLRVVDNERYPAFFSINDLIFSIKIEKKKFL